MTKVTKTYLQLLKANVLIMQYYEKHKNTENKLIGCMVKFATKQLNAILEEYNDKLDTIQLLNCATDPITHVILKDSEGKKQYTPEGAIKLKEDGKKLLFQEIEITPIIADGIEDLLSEFSEEQKEILSGIVIP